MIRYSAGCWTRTSGSSPRSSRTMLCVLLLLQCVCAVWSDYAIQSIRGEVGAGNYTYYKLQWDGPVSIVLDSLTGDADLYVSKTLLKPSFDPEEFDFSSATCGQDLVEIPTACPRPLGVAVYGHPYHSTSGYELHLVYRDPDYLDQFTLHPQNDTEEAAEGTPGGRSGQPHGSAEGSEDSRWLDLLWTFFEVFLEVLLL